MMESESQKSRNSGPDSRARRDLLALDRRGFLRLAGLAAGAGLLPAGCADAPTGQGPPPDLALTRLTPRSYAVLNAAAARVAGPRGAALVREGRVDPARTGEAFLAGSPDLAGPLGQALLLLEFGVWPLLGKLRPFTALDDAGRDAVLAELRDSRLALKRRAFNGIRSVCLLCFYAAVAEARPPGFEIGLIPPDATIAAAMAE